jgi:hypothetical protein
VYCCPVEYGNEASLLRIWMGSQRIFTVARGKTVTTKYEMKSTVHPGN